MPHCPDHTSNGPQRHCELCSQSVDSRGATSPEGCKEEAHLQQPSAPTHHLPPRVKVHPKVLAFVIRPWVATRNQIPHCTVCHLSSTSESGESTSKRARKY